MEEVVRIVGAEGESVSPAGGGVVPPLVPFASL